MPLIDPTEVFLLDGLAPTAVASIDDQLCDLSDNLSLNGDPVAGETVTARIAVPPQEMTDASLSITEVSTTTGLSGNWTLRLVRGQRYRVKIVAAGINRVVTIPDQANAVLRELD